LSHMLRSLLTAALLAAAFPVCAQEIVVKSDNDKFSGNESTRQGDALTEWEESIILRPTGPCTLKKVLVYWDGEQPNTDTLWIVGDPAEGGYQPTLWVARYNKLTEPIVINYDGTPGWDTIDVSDRNIHISGHSRVCIQHRIQDGGPYFAQDNSVQVTGSFLLNPFDRLFPQYDIPGKIMIASKKFMVRLVVTYDFPTATGSQPAPKATLVDVAKAAGFVTGTATLDAARVSIADWNNDGFDDVHTGGRFFQNNKNGTFTDVTSSTGVSAAATAFGDFNNDGLLDIYAVNGMNADKIYRATAPGVWQDITASTGFSNPNPPVTPIWLDYDRDGLLDIFIANGRTEDAGGEEYFPDQLWRNNGNETFTNVSAQAGIEDGEPEPYYDTWGASVTDFNNDGLTDIFVATYRLAPDMLFRNTASKVFVNVAEETGTIGEPTDDEGYYGHGVGTEWGDFNNDGYPDLAVGNLGHPDYRGKSSNPSLLYKNSGPPGYTFEDVHMTHGPKFYEMNTGVVWLDLNLDGFLDLWHCQYSYYTTSQDVFRRSRMYINQGPDDDYRLEDKTWDLGSNVHGAWTAARLDMDNDGDMDLFVASDKESVKLYRNDVAKSGRYLSIRLKGDPAQQINMDAYGTTVRAYAGGRQYFRELQGGGGGTTSSQNSSIINIGVGDVSHVDSLVVRFMNGLTKKFENIATNQSYVITPAGIASSSVKRDFESAGSISTMGDVLRYSLDDRAISITIFNLLGQQIRYESISGLEGTVSLAGLPSGTYLVRLETASGTVDRTLNLAR
ncbi:MAG TPA: FG-GAP-like repeat-containing protein, partial [Candidatus Kapabacteria bacterium]|nr:FG-GAP-like repeat-containing protein [Candidatus Kapabacteria bacterium]